MGVDDVDGGVDEEIVHLCLCLSIFFKKGDMIAKVFILIFISTGEMIRFDKYFSNVETNHHV